MQILQTGNKKSEALTKDEFKALKKYRSLFGSEEACAVSIGIGRTVLNRILLAGSGHPDTVSKVRTILIQMP